MDKTKSEVLQSLSMKPKLGSENMDLYYCVQFTAYCVQVALLVW